MHILCRSPRISVARMIGLCACLLVLFGAGQLLCAAPTTPVAAPSGEDFGQYLVDHQSDLAPFFNDHLEDLIRKAMPMVWGLLAWITIITLVVGFPLDLVLARGFTPFFAPAYAKMKRAVFYAGGRLLLGLLVMGLMAAAVFLCLSLVHAGIILLVVGIILFLVMVATQVGWLAYLFRMNVGSAIIFFVIIFGAQVIVFILVASSLLVGQPPVLTYRFVNQTLAPELQSEVESTNQELAAIKKANDETKAKIAGLQAQIAKDTTEAENLNKKIESKKNSEGYLFQQIAKLEAQGNLSAAHDQYAAMLTKYPSGALAETVKTHLTQIETEIATQEAQKKQAEAEALAAAEAARADLLARAGRGEVSLSEMRQVLFGKSRADVSALFGQPTETASDRWGYAQQMIFNPMTKEKHGLTIVFADGKVQSVDYYYGRPK